MPRGAWTRVTIELDASQNTMSLAINGSTVMEAEPFRYPVNGLQAPALAIGTLTDNNLTAQMPACTVKIDDVAFDIEP